MSELNEDRAKWAGFKRANIKEHYHYESGYRVADWLEPCGVSRDIVPQFDLSLDACFEHLVPKAIKEFGKADVSQLIEDWAWVVIYEGRKPAHSFCKALDRLISEHE